MSDFTKRATGLREQIPNVLLPVETQLPGGIFIEFSLGWREIEDHVKSPQAFAARKPEAAFLTRGSRHILNP